MKVALQTVIDIIYMGDKPQRLLLKRLNISINNEKLIGRKINV